MMHTPGPWAVVYGGNFLQVWRSGLYPQAEYLDRASGCVADIKLSPDRAAEDPTAQADARLIAAAPDLIDLLDLLLKAHKQQVAEGRTPLPGMDTARALLTRIRGT